MNFNFSEKINNFLKIILKNTQEHSLRVFFVGGIVRDNILNISTKDIDLLLMGNAIEFSKSLPKEIKIKSIHEEFCTVKLEYENIEIDIASSRTEKYPYSGCLPVVDEIGVDIKKDVLRRDFSVNSLYCELKLDNDKITYRLIDLVNGIEDLKQKKLKSLHKNSYIDDPTRILRGVNFKHRFGFDFSDEDKILIQEYLNKISFENMSIARNEKVLKKTLDNKFIDEIFKEIIEKNYYKIINKNNATIDISTVFEVEKIFNLNQKEKNNFYYDVIINSPYEKKELKTILEIFQAFSKYKNYKIAYYYYKTKDNNALIYNNIKDIKLFICGKDLINNGYKEGKKLGEILNTLLEKKLKNPDIFKNKEAEITWVLRNYPKH